MQRALTALILAVALLAAPAAAFAQSAGDDQYVDPFQGDGGGGQQEQPEQPQPTEQPAPAPPSSSGQAAGAVVQEAVPAQSAAPTLPRTGLPALALLGAGFALLAGGATLRRRL